MTKQIKMLGNFLKKLDAIDTELFDDSTTEEREDVLIESFNDTVAKATRLLTTITVGQISERTAELMVRAKRNSILALVARVK